VGRDSVVGTAIRYGVNVRGIESRERPDFLRLPDRSSGLSSFLHNGYRIIPTLRQHRTTPLLPLRAFILGSRVKFTFNFTVHTFAINFLSSNGHEFCESLFF
jgi:hypothetical protein